MRILCGGILLYDVYHTRAFTFESLVVTDDAATKERLAGLTKLRNTLMKALEGENSNAVIEASTAYVAELHHLVAAFEEMNNQVKTKGPMIFVWTSACTMHTLKFIAMTGIHFELLMTLMTKASAICSQAALALDGVGAASVSIEEAAKAIGLRFREAAGIYEYCANNVIPRTSCPKEHPIETRANFCLGMSQLCLGQVQQVLLRRAAELNTAENTIAGLCRGCEQIFSQGKSLIDTLGSETALIESCILTLTMFNPQYYKAMVYKGMGQFCWKNSEFGKGIGYMKTAHKILASFVGTISKENANIQSLRGKMLQELEVVRELVTSYETENSKIYHELIREDASSIPIPEAKIMVKPIPYELPQDSPANPPFVLQPQD